MDSKVIDAVKKRMERRSPVPLYYQLERCVEGMIRNSQILPGERLPGASELARELGVNHLTVRKAFSNLVEKKLVRRTRRAGTFVR